MRSGELEFAKAPYREVFREARPYLQTRHNEVHVRCSYGFTLRLLAEEDADADADVVVPAILLHDVGWSRVPEGLQLTAFGPRPTNPELTRVHELEGAKIASEILERVGGFARQRDEILTIIAGHDTRLSSLGTNDALVKDADKLFRISREGFPIDCGRFGLAPRSHLAWLEERIESWFFTASAKRAARREVARRAGELAAAAADPGVG